MLSTKFTTDAGVRLGDSLLPDNSLSSHGLCLLMDDNMKITKQSAKKIIIGNWRMKHVQMSEMAIVDDIAPLVRSNTSTTWSFGIRRW